MPFSAGQILNNRYRIVRLLGQGGFGAVHKAWDLNFELPCALKENTETSLEAQRQFEREARFLRILRHPNLPQVNDYFVIPGLGQYLVMDYVEGEDLQQMLERSSGPLPESQVLKWIGQVCDALSYLHSQTPPIIHRDVKPANIKITSQGNAILVDFGIAKLYDPQLRTTAGAKAVTPGYSPIEQYGRGGHTDTRSDVYSLGATLYTLLTGQEPVDAPERNLGLVLPAPSSLNLSITPRIEAATLKAMEILPENRFQSVEMFKAAIEETPVSGRTNAPIQLTQVIRGSTVPLISAATSHPFPWGWIGVVGVVSLVVIFLLVRIMIIGYGIPDHSKTQTALSGVVIVLTDTAEMPIITETHKSIATLMKTFTPRPPTTTPTITPTEEPTPSPTDLAIQFTDEKGVEMALVPTGEFQMGSEYGENDERSVHAVYLDAFYIDLTEVTNAMYSQCVQEGICTSPYSINSELVESYFGDLRYENYPVINVDWYQAGVYCEWRNARLPTEAEWEKAARGTDGRSFPWGDYFGNFLANFCDKNCMRTWISFKWRNENYDDGFWDTAPVGYYRYGTSPYGLMEMAGNVSEWVFDWYSETFYNNSPYENPRGPDSGECRVQRGGNWISPKEEIRTSERVCSDPNGYNKNLGFRCALSP